MHRETFMTTTEKQRILVTVKPYPTLSRKYGETVCTAGIREDGTWVRIYPVPFRFTFNLLIIFDFKINLINYLGVNYLLY